MKSSGDNGRANHADLSFLSGANAGYLESLYREMLEQDAIGSLPAQQKEWQTVFSSLPGMTIGFDPSVEAGYQAWFESLEHKQAQVSKLITAYRSLGHLRADIDPIGVMPRGSSDEIRLERYDLGAEDLDTEFDTGDLAGGGRMTLRGILDFLQAVYCGSIGYEIRYLHSLEKRVWLQRQAEVESRRLPFADDLRIEILERLTAAEGLEKYLHTRYVGQKRFSLEGGESLIPMLSDLIQQFGAKGVKEVVIGMAHRGRLNVLVNTLGKAPGELFSEFEGEYEVDCTDTRTGDVKYHQGVSSDILTAGGNVHVALSFNPSHLEIISPVVQGSVRARQERRRDSGRKQVIPILIHGDAAFAGQGVVMETLNMATTRGFSTGGTIHIIINNQIGFTTNTLDARSTVYCTEIAKLVQAPILHINGDDPDAIIFAARVAMQYRMKFGGDFVLDIVCYRRHGHNEADEPTMTQPIMYGKIKRHKTTRQLYAEKLVDEGIIQPSTAERMVRQYRDRLDEGHVVAGQVIDPNKSLLTLDWSPFMGEDWREEVDTGFDARRLVELAEILSRSPDDFIVHKRVQGILDERVAMSRGEKPMDWGCAELLAYATLIDNKYQVRLSGQDAGRGTFSHRHATLHDQSQPRTYIPLQYAGASSSDFLIINSLLSEEAVLGFEYGYSTTEPRTLVVWEAQFGDFVNGAQVVIDQFISSGHAKWARVCSLVLFLPHGMEGQGPEHSSARLERFLQLCAERSMQVCVPTTPAQLFHMLRRQMMRSFRRPLIVMTPKSLLRHKLAVCAPDDLAGGRFHAVLPEVEPLPPETVKKVIICCGKVYYDLLEERRKREQKNVAIIRLEQIHPFPDIELQAEMEKYSGVRDIVWCQEEPKNQGCWYQITFYLRNLLNRNQTLAYVGRAGSPSPAVGFFGFHLEQQKRLIQDALSVSD